MYRGLTDSDPNTMFNSGKSMELYCIESLSSLETLGMIQEHSGQCTAKITDRLILIEMSSTQSKSGFGLTESRH